MLRKQSKTMLKNNKKQKGTSDEKIIELFFRRKT